VNAAQLPVKGDGYLIPPTWAARGLSYGTDELVGLIVRAARRVALEQPGAVLHVADLSPRRGGASAWHRSHQTGRDADLHFYALDPEGNPAPPPTLMLPFDAAGVSPPSADGRMPVRVFDVATNWLLTRALLEDPVVEVQFLFVSAPLREKLLEHAVALGEPAELVERARALLVQPGDSLPHDDHLHLRIYCPAGDRALGCFDRGPQRWLKKDWKYVASRPRPSAVEPAVQLAPGPMCRLPALAVIAR
jgi:penicillin-insensitive murein endopeptidase